ncbi:unnamed protein product, partial [Mesorhabditis spiculigera]
MELVIQLAIIMCGKQFISAIMETLGPKVAKEIRKRRLARKGKKTDGDVLSEEKSELRWESDYYLKPVTDQFLFEEYLEMVLQFGFVTLFVAAFPLAPLFALLNNILEIRLDAYKFVAQVQRPLPALAKNIGIWLPILDKISKLSVTINALVIAFTSEFIPRAYYYFTHDKTLKGYVDFSLSNYTIKNMPAEEDRKFFQGKNVTTCSYRGYYNDKLEHNEDWWHILAFRLLFVVVFEQLVYLLKVIIAYLIPDVPAKIVIQQQREKYLARQALIAQGPNV